MDILISVIIPVYNAQKYIEACLQSVINQKYQNLEIILIDDGSTDSSGEILDRYIELDSRIKVIHISNSGVSKARNVGLSFAQGDYVTFVDADDWISDDMYYEMVMLAENCQMDLVQCSYDLIYEDREKRDIIKPSQNYKGKEQIMLAYCKEEISPSTCNKMFGRKIFKDARFDEHLSVGEDRDIVYRFCQKCNQVVSSNQIFYHYRQSAGSAMRNQLNARHFEPLKIIDGQLKENIDTGIIYNLLKEKEVYFTIDLLLRAISNRSCEDFLPELYHRITDNFTNIFWGKNYPIKFKIVALLNRINPSILNLVLSGYVRFIRRLQ